MASTDFFPPGQLLLLSKQQDSLCCVCVSVCVHAPLFFIILPYFLLFTLFPDISS